MSVWLQDLSATAVFILSRLLCPLLERLPSMQGYRASLFGTGPTLTNNCNKTLVHDGDPEGLEVHTWREACAGQKL